MSPSKRANKREPSKKRNGAQKEKNTSSARSSHVNQQGTSNTVNTADAKPGPEARKNNVAMNLLRILALFAVVGITLYVFSIRERVEQFAQFGYPGVFLIALLANATVLLPAPGVALIYAMGAIFNPIGVALAAGTGGALGELSGYVAGFSGQAVIERTDVYERIKPWVDKYGGWAILVLSAIPNPFFDVAGIAAGIAKMPVHVFLIFTWIGQLIKMGMFAFAGKYSIHLFTTLFQ